MGTVSNRVWGELYPKLRSEEFVWFDLVGFVAKHYDPEALSRTRGSWREMREITMRRGKHEDGVYACSVNNLIRSRKTRDVLFSFLSRIL